MTSTTATTTATRFNVSANVRLSICSFPAPANRTTYAVALLRYNGSRWAVDHTTAAEFTGADAEDMRYRATDFGAELVTKELGEFPPRFFRDNAR